MSPFEKEAVAGSTAAMEETRRDLLNVGVDYCPTTPPGGLVINIQ